MAKQGKLILSLRPVVLILDQRFFLRLIIPNFLDIDFEIPFFYCFVHGVSMNPNTYTHTSVMAL